MSAPFRYSVAGTVVTLNRMHPRGEWFLPNHAMHADSAPTLRFHIGDPCRRAGDGERSAMQRLARLFRTFRGLFCDRSRRSVLGI
jgi:hypothetical protein